MSGNLYVYNDENRIMLFDGASVKSIFDIAEYRDVLSNMGNSKYSFFDIIKNDYGVKDKKEIKEKFLYLFNFILVNNISNYIIDTYLEGELYELIFDSSIREFGEQSIKLSGELNLVDVIGDTITCLINSDEYLDGKIKMDYGTVPSAGATVEEIGIETIFNYTPKGVLNLKDRLREDLIAYKYVTTKKDEYGRYILPIYVDHDSLIAKGMENYSDYLVNWVSLSYLKMLTIIHDYFVDYYKLDYKKGLQSDDLMLNLIDLLAAEVTDYPKGLQKSIEVGRATKGKCFFIDTVVTPVSLSQDLAMILQAKDAYSVVPKIFKSNR